MKENSFFSRIFGREKRIPFSIKGVLSFYTSLMGRYWYLLGFMAVFTLFYSAVTALRLGFISIVVDGLPTVDATAGSGGAAKGKFAEFLRQFWEWGRLKSVEWGFGDFERTDTNLLIFLGVAICSIGICAAVFYYLKEMIAQRMVVRMLVDTRKALFRHLASQSVSFFHNRRSGDLLSRVTNDVGIVQQSLLGIFETLLQQPFLLIAYLTTAYLANSLLFWCTIPAYFFIIYPVMRASRKVLRHSRKRQKKLGMITEALQQLFGGIRIVKAFGMEERELAEFGEKNREFQNSFLKSKKARVFGRTVQELLFNLALAGLLIGGSFLITSKTLTMGDFCGFCMALIMLFQPVKKISQSWNAVVEARPGVERVLEILNETPEIRDVSDAVEFPERFGKISFEGVSFAYQVSPGQESESPLLSAALKDINLEVGEGEIVALVGPSGSGKTTFVDIVARFYDPTEGGLHVDDVDIRQFQHASYLDNIAIVSQEPFLFNTSIMENIRYGSDSSTDEDVIEAAKIANAHGFIMLQEDGYETVIGDRGMKLSGGQRQRLTIARAMLKNAPILILDEATSALDSEAEKEVQKGINNLMERRTTFVIAHRLSTITGADKIVVLDNGNIVEVGTHEELLKREGRYHGLYTSQNPDYIFRKQDSFSGKLPSGASTPAT
ncbi:MAG: ABC transporter ATP-binding protein, partial [Planctomycetota bacterium]|nr:ABC transporter ATP-binding protein [Planctomycetota bacterium]